MFRPPTCSGCVLSIHHWEFPTGASWSPKPIILGGSTSVFNWEVGPGSFWWVIVLNDYSYTSGRTNYYAGHRCPFPIGSLVNWRTLWDESPMEEAISIGNWIVATKQGVSPANMEDIKPYWILPKMKYHFLNHLEAFCFSLFLHISPCFSTESNTGRWQDLIVDAPHSYRREEAPEPWRLIHPAVPKGWRDPQSWGGTQGMAGWFMYVYVIRKFPKMDKKSPPFSGVSMGDVQKM